MSVFKGHGLPNNSQTNSPFGKQYNSKLIAILVTLIVVLNVAMLTVAHNAELMHGVWVTNVQLVATAVASYFFLRR